MKTYNTINGLNLLTDWEGERFNESEFIKNTKTARAAAARLFPALKFERGEAPRTAAAFYDEMPYTSTSAFAAVWACNWQAVKTGEPLKRFDGIAITDDGRGVAVWTEYDENGDECGEVFTIV